jgi:Na+-driven multidrug efflux pump
MGTVVMLVSSCLLLLGRNQLGRLFSSELDVVMLTAQAVPPLAVSLIGEVLLQPQGLCGAYIDLYAAVEAWLC